MRMLRIALGSLKARWVSLLGAFTALALGVAMTAVMLLGLASAVGAPGGEELVSLVAALGTAGGVSAFVSAFVVASTFSYAVAQRRRELGLLRLAGATRAQVRRTVLAEALFLGAAASAAGCALGRLGAPVLVRWLGEVGLAPAGFALRDAAWPLPCAFWTGLLVALAGVTAAARRAGRVGPLDALCAADLDSGVMTAGRLLWGLGLLLTAAALAAVALATDPADLLHRKTYTTRPMLLISACGLLAPALTRPLVHVLGRLPLGRLHSRPARSAAFAVRMVRGNAAAAVRRTGAVAAPVLVAVALTGSLAGALDTVAAARTAEAAARTAADLVIVPAAAPAGPAPATDGPAPATGRLVEALRAVPGTAAVSPTAPTRLALVEPDGNTVRAEARMADPAGLAALARLPVRAGSPADLADDAIVLPAEWGRTAVGEPVPVIRADGSRTTLRVAAVLRDGVGDNGLYVTARNAPGARVDRIEVRLAPGAGPAERAAATARLREAAQPYGATVLTRDGWLAATSPANGRIAWLRTVLVLGLALLYTGIALANTLLTSTADRRRELALLRLAGATRAQVVRLVTAESALVAIVGAVLGCIVTAAQLGMMRTGLAALGAPAPWTVPWRPVGAVAAASVLVAMACAAPAAAWALRHRPVTAAAR
ncbi:FtsX-like permease family protein [Kitasatospora sp. NPDC090091]|uniref:FtsX-like permease family protein n=1 Tax=Kitasatospora sp. NPDC090091 TaxID=3364081 RepID=UPI0037FE7397